MARDLMDGQIQAVRVEFDPRGSLATTHHSHGSDMGLWGGLLGWDAWDERLANSPRAIREAGIRTEIAIVDLNAPHPNTYRLSLQSGKERHHVTALSTGGGTIEVIEVDGIRVSMAGDYYETLLYLDAEADGAALVRTLGQRVDADQILLLEGTDGQLIEVKGQRFLGEDLLSELRARYGLRSTKRLAPVLPVRSRAAIRVPFITCEDMLAYGQARGLALWELAVHYESARGGLSHEQVLGQMREVVDVMQGAIRDGLAGTAYADRILGVQSRAYQARMEAGQLLDAGMLNRMILYLTAVMEVKSALGLIVAAPTAGACGVLPGALLGAGEAIGLSLDEVTRAMLAAGMIGLLIAARSTFAAEVGGCQAECGAASGMAAAGLVELARGTARQATDAASMALQNVLGLVCDPVANRVEVPCMGRNAMAASNALACANMALAGYDPVIPLDQVIEAMDRVGRSIAPQLRCTALGGLSVTPASKEVERRLEAGRA
jgi:L-serine dehydratase